MNLATDKRNLSSYDLFQLTRYGNILPKQPAIQPGEELEEGKQAAEDAANWTEAEHEKQLNEYD